MWPVWEFEVTHVVLRFLGTCKLPVAEIWTGWSDQGRTPKELLGGSCRNVGICGGWLENIRGEGSLHSEEETGSLVPVSGLKDAESFVI